MPIIRDRHRLPSSVFEEILNQIRKKNAVSRLFEVALRRGGLKNSPLQSHGFDHRSFGILLEFNLLSHLQIVKRVVFDRLGRKIKVFTAGVRPEISISLRLGTALGRKARLKTQVYDFSDFTTWHARSDIFGRSPGPGISAMWKIRMKAASQLAALRTSRFNRLTNPFAVA
jgi:hypothetical protein